MFTRGGALPHTTGHNERNADSEAWRRVARAGRNAPGRVMDLNIVIDDTNADVTVRAPAQTQRAMIGRGPHRISIAYRAERGGNGQRGDRFYLYDSTLSTLYEVLRAALPAEHTEFAVTITPPPELAGNLFRWRIDYAGAGVFELQQVSFVKEDREP